MMFGGAFAVCWVGAASAALPGVLPAFRSGDVIRVVLDDAPEKRVRCATPTIADYDENEDAGLAEDGLFELGCPLAAAEYPKLAPWVGRELDVHDETGVVCRRAVKRLAAVGRMIANFEYCGPESGEAGDRPRFLAEEARWLVVGELDGAGCGQPDPEVEPRLFARPPDAPGAVLRAVEVPPAQVARVTAAFRRSPEYRRIQRTFLRCVKEERSAQAGEDCEAGVSDWTHFMSVFGEEGGVSVTGFGTAGGPPAFISVTAATGFNYGGFHGAHAALFTSGPNGSIRVLIGRRAPPLLDEWAADEGWAPPAIIAIAQAHQPDGPVIVVENGVLWRQRGRWQRFDHAPSECGGIH